MQALAGAAIAILIGASILVAVRLLLLYTRTRGTPEMLLGTMLLLSVGVGYPASIAATRPDFAWAALFQGIGYVSVSTGFTLLFVFTARVFRPEATWARVLAGVGSLALLGKAVHGCIQLTHNGVADMTRLPVLDIVLQTVPVAVAYLWTACESLHYYGVMRRRVSIGLADVAVADRFLLWAMMGLACASGVLLNTGAVIARMDTFHDARILIASSVTGLMQTVFLVLAFVPPRAYVSWVRSRSAAPAV